MQNKLNQLCKVYPDMPIKNLSTKLVDALPKCKDDMDAVQKIKELEYPEIAPILPHLLTWLKDANWPIAKNIADKLVSIGQPVMSHVKKILNGNDDLWKYWVMLLVVKKMDPMCIQKIKFDLEKISLQNDPEETYMLAKEILECLKC